MYNLAKSVSVSYVEYEACTRTRSCVPSNLVVLVVVDSFDDIDLAGLENDQQSIQVTFQSNTYIWPLTTADSPPCRPDTCKMNHEDQDGRSPDTRYLPQPHGARLRSRMNNPVLYWAWLEMRTLCLVSATSIDARCGQYRPTPVDTCG